MSVHYYLVTSGIGPRMDTWAVTAAFANWIEGREHGNDGNGYWPFGDVITSLPEYDGDDIRNREVAEELGDLVKILKARLGR